MHLACEYTHTDSLRRQTNGHTQSYMQACTFTLVSVPDTNQQEIRSYSKACGPETIISKSRTSGYARV